MNNKVSVIVPVYNVSGYLNKCIDTLTDQTYTNIEIILVDDGSTDNSGEICDEEAEKDSRIKVIHKINGGLSDARNEGILKASGDYLLFVDSDDYVEHDLVEKTMNILKNNDCDIVIFQYDYVYEDDSPARMNTIHKEEKIMTNEEAMIKLFTDDSFGGTVTWNKLYKRTVFTDTKIKFPYKKLHEDCFTTYKLYYYAKKIVYTPYIGYHYLQRQSSIMSSKFSLKYLDKFAAADECLEFVKNHCANLEKQCVNFYVHLNIQVINKMLTGKADLSEVWEKAATDIKKVQYMNNEYIEKKYKLLSFLIVKSKLLYKFIYYCLYSLKNHLMFKKR